MQLIRSYENRMSMDISIFSAFLFFVVFRDTPTSIEIRRANIKHIYKEILSTDWFLSMGYQSGTVEYI